MLFKKQISLTDVQVKFKGNTGTFKGYASVFDGIDSYGDRIQRGAYTRVIEKIAGGEESMPKMFINHRSWDIPPGKWMTLSEDDTGLLMEGEFTPGNPEGQIVKAALQHGTIDGLSIGFQLGEFEMIKENNREIRLIKSVAALPEVSIVTFPADEAARVDLNSVKSSLDKINSLKELEAFLREAGGFSKALATATASRAKRIIVQGDPAGKTELPEDLKQLIAANLNTARIL